MSSNDRRLFSRREFLALAAGAAGALSLAGCGSRATPEVIEREVEVTRMVEGTPVVEKVIETVVVTPEEMVEEAPPAGPVTVRMWDVWGGSRVPLMEAQLAAFHELNPDITVDELLIDQATMNEKYLTAMAAGDPPDVIMVLARYFPKFADQRTLLHLDPFLTMDDMVVDDIFFESEYQAFQWRGETYALPQSAGGIGAFLYYNIDHLAEAGYDEPPRTWQELEEVSEALTSQMGNEFDRIAFDISGGNSPFKELVYLNAGKLINDDVSEFTFDSPEGSYAMEWMVGYNDQVYGGYENMINQIGVAKWRSEPWEAGLVSMMIHGAWSIVPLLEAELEFEWGVTHMPYNANNPAAGVRVQNDGGWSYAIPKVSQHHDAAWELLKYITAGEGNLNFMKGMARPSPVKEYQNDPWFADNNPFWDEVAYVLENRVAVPNTPVQTEVEAVLLEMRENALYHKMTADEAIAWGKEQAQGYLDEYLASA